MKRSPAKDRKRERFPGIGVASDRRWDKPVGPTIRFSAVIKVIQGINLSVDVPAASAATLKARGNVPVTGTMDGVPIRVTLIPLGGRYRLFVNGMMSKATGKGAGKRAAFVLRRDAGSRMPPMHPALAAALRRNARAKAVFAKMSPSYRKEWVRYLWFMKSPEALERNVKKMLAILTGRRHSSAAYERKKKEARP